MIYQIKPDTTLDNKRLETTLINLHLYRGLEKRLNIDLKNVSIKVAKQYIIGFEILLSKDEITFYYIIPDDIEELAFNELSVSYPKSTIKSVEDHNLWLTGAKEFTLANHFFMSLKVDKRAEFPLNAILESSRMLRQDERVLFQYLLEPVSDDWVVDAAQSIEEFHEGHLRKKMKLDKAAIATLGVKAVYEVATEALDIFSIFLTNENYQKEDLDKLAFSSLFRKGLSGNTKEKLTGVGYNTTVRIATDSRRSEMILKLFSRNFNTLIDDNKFIERDIEEKKLINAVKNRLLFPKLDADVLSSRELAQMMLLPTISFQQNYPIPCIDMREVKLPGVFTGTNGLEIADYTYRGRTQRLRFPLDDFDSLCQVWVNIGKMGSGKTTNGENMAIQLLKNGFSVFAIDVADGKLINHIEMGLPPNFKKVIDLDFGDTKNPISLSWSETAQCSGQVNIETKLASQLRNFLNKLARSETSDRMERFLGACAKATFKKPTANLYDVILCLTDYKYRHKIIEDYHIEGRLKYTLEQLDDDKTGTKGAYIAGVMDRLDALLDNEYVANCLLQDANPKINFRKWADEGYFVGIRVPKDTLLDDATDLLVTYIVSKLWLAVLTRKELVDKGINLRPCFLILDEPHQFPTVFSELYSIVREMRKWRLGMIILAHEFGDFKSIKNLLKSAGTNYFIYSTSKETYKELLEELAPFTLEELLKTKWHNAVIAIRYKDVQICVEAKMLPPLIKEDKKSINRLPNIWGKPQKEVEQNLLDKMIL